MTADPRRIVVIESSCQKCDAGTVLVHHLSFPELRVEALSAENAATLLVNRLVSAHDVVSDTLHREAIQAAIADARAFMDREGYPHPGRDASTPLKN